MSPVDVRLLAAFAVAFAALTGVAGALGYLPEALVAGALTVFCAWRAIQAGWP